MINPLAGNVVVEQEQGEEKTQSGIFLPDVAKEKPEVATVVESASKYVKKGDKILFKKWSPYEVKEGKKNYLIINEEDILAIYE